MDYALPAHISYCWVGSQVMFLDTKRDRYFSLNANATASLKKLERATPLESSDHFVLRSLLGQGVLVERSAGVITPCLAPEIAASALDDKAPAVTEFRRMPALIGHMLVAKWTLKRRNLSVLLDALQTRRVHVESGLTSTRRRELSLVAHSFVRAGHLIGSLDQCLPQTVGLMQYLTRRGMSSSLVFGVMMRPFAAHCWLQINDLVISDTLESVGKFTPIRVV